MLLFFGGLGLLSVSFLLAIAICRGKILVALRQIELRSYILRKSCALSCLEWGHGVSVEWLAPAMAFAAHRGARRRGRRQRNPLCQTHPCVNYMLYVHIFTHIYTQPSALVGGTPKFAKIPWARFISTSLPHWGPGCLRQT